MMPPEVEGDNDWAHIFTSTAFATEYLHPELGAGWTAMLLEACCVRAEDQRDYGLPVGETLRLGRSEAPPRPCGPYVNPIYQRHVPRLMRHVDLVAGGKSLIEWAGKLGYEIDGWTFSCAAALGHLDTCRWLREERDCDEFDFAASFAARVGSIDLLEFLGPGHALDQDTCSNAAMGGHLDVLKWLREGGCPWDESTTYAASEGGHLGVLKYAHESGCPWDPLTCEAAAKGGRLDVLKYAHESG